MRDLNFLRDRLQKFLKERASGKKLIIINSHDKVDAISGIIKALSGIFDPNTYVLCFKSIIPEALEPLSDRIRILNDYIGPEDCRKIDDYVFSGVSKRWDASAYRGIELGRIAEYDLQLYLLTKVKALVVMTKAVGKEGYNAIFIIDSNGELDGFDNLLRRLFNISCVLVPICERPAPILSVKRWMASLVSDILDNIMPLFIGNSRGTKLIDTRLFYSLGLESRHDYIPAFFEKGLRARLRCLVKGRPYIAFRTRTQGIGKRLDFKDLADQFVYNDTPYWDVVESRIMSLVTADFARFRKNIDIFLGAAAAHKIKSVTLRNDLKELEKTVVLAAKVAAIPTVVVQHGILAERNGHDKIYADRLVAWGEYSIRWYSNFGNDSRKIAITGSPEFENISTSHPQAKTGKRLVTLISPGQSMCRQTAYLSDDVAEVMIKTIIKACESIGGVDLVVKLHPNEDLAAFKKFVKREKKSFVSVIDKTDIHRLINMSDAVIIMDSTVGLEAVILGKPLIVTNFIGRPDLVPYVEKKVAIGVYKREDAEGAIRKVLNDKAVKQDMVLARDGFLKDLVYGRDGMSRTRILCLIESL